MEANYERGEENGVPDGPMAMSGRQPQRCCAEVRKPAFPIAASDRGREETGHGEESAPRVKQRSRAPGLLLQAAFDFRARRVRQRRFQAQLVNRGDDGRMPTAIPGNRDTDPGALDGPGAPRCSARGLALFVASCPGSGRPLDGLDRIHGQAPSNVQLELRT